MSKVVCMFCRGEVIDGECECNERHVRLLIRALSEDINGVRLRAEEDIAPFEFEE